MTRSEVGIVLPPIPAKRYFTIGEVAELCGVKPHVLRYWEQEFTQLRPLKRRGNRRYYQHHEVLLVRRIRELLYEQGFTISGARNRLSDPGAAQQLEESLSLSTSHLQALRADLQELSDWLASGLETAEAFARQMAGLAQAADRILPATAVAAVSDVVGVGSEPDEGSEPAEPRQTPAGFARPGEGVASGHAADSGASADPLVASVTPRSFGVPSAS